MARESIYETEEGRGERGGGKGEVWREARLLKEGEKGVGEEEEEKKGVKNLTAWSSPRRVISRSNTRER